MVVDSADTRNLLKSGSIPEIRYCLGIFPYICILSVWQSGSIPETESYFSNQLISDFMHKLRRIICRLSIEYLQTA